MDANITNETRKKVYRRDGWRCALCDSTRYIQIHHAVPRGQGGPDTEQNLITLCSDCHALAHGLDLRGLGASQEDVQQSIIEYLADRYAEDGVIWNPWTAENARASGPKDCFTWEEVTALIARAIQDGPR